MPPLRNSTSISAGARVQAVLQQFLERGGGAVDDFSRGDLVDEKLGEYANGGHGCGAANSMIIAPALARPSVVPYNPRLRLEIAAAASTTR